MKSNTPMIVDGPLQCKILRPSPLCHPSPMDRDPCNLLRWVLNLPFSVGTNQSLQIKKFSLVGLAKIFSNVFWMHQNKLLQVSLCDNLNFGPHALSLHILVSPGTSSLSTPILNCDADKKKKWQINEINYM